MATTSNNTRHLPTVASLRQEAQCVTDRIVARARAAHQFGATAEAYRSSAMKLERQAARAEKLLFGQAVKTFHEAVAENRLIADALDIFEGEDGA